MQFAALILPTEPWQEAKAATELSLLSPIAGKAFHQWLVDAALGASVRRVAVVSSGLAPETRAAFDGRSDDPVLHIVRPKAASVDTIASAIDQIGTDFTLRDGAHLVLLPSSCPQITSADIRRVVDHHVATKAAATICSGEADTGLAEPVISRDVDGRVSSIIDVPRGGGQILCFRADVLVPAMRRSRGGSDFDSIGVEAANVLRDGGHRVETIEYQGRLEAVRSGPSRVEVEAMLRRRIVMGWIERGVMMSDPAQVSIDASVHLGKGVTILPGSVLEGRTVVADGARIGPNTHLINATVGSAAQVPHSVVEGVEVPPRSSLQPFTVLRPTAG